MLGEQAHWQTLSRSIREKRKSLADELAQGKININEYREWVGRIGSLDWVLEESAHILGDVQRPEKPIEMEEEEIVL